MAYGTGQLSNVPAQAVDRPETALESVNKRLEVAIDDMANSARQLHQLADRIFGGRPEAVNKAGAETPLHCIMATFERQTSRLDEVASALRDARERLSQL